MLAIHSSSIINSPSYRTIHCDGAHGGITPRGQIQFTLFNERNTIPKITSRTVEEVVGANAYTLGAEKIEETLSGVIRQLEVTVFMDMNGSRELFLWLGKKVWLLEETMGIPESEREGIPPKSEDEKK